MIASSATMKNFLPRRYAARRAFIHGMVAVIAIYAALAGWAWIQSNTQRDALDRSLPQQTVVILRGEKPATPAPDTITGENETAPTESTPETAEQETPDEEAPVQETPIEETLTQETPVQETAIAGPAVDYMENGMAVAPVAGLSETTADGTLPIARATDRLRPFDAYRQPFRPAGASGVPIISILISDIGLSDSMSAAILRDLPPEISVAVTPYATTPDQWITRARQSGHEVWLHLPVENADYPINDPGPQTLLINAIEKQNMAKLHWALSRGVGYVGVVTEREPAFIKSLNDMRPVISDVYRRGLGFVDGDVAASDVPRTMAVGMDSPYAHADIWIDQTLTPDAVAKALTDLERLAANRGSAIGFANANPLTIKAIAEWSAGLKGKGLALAPLSAATRVAP